jgi:hypothetical protein
MTNCEKRRTKKPLTEEETILDVSGKKYQRRSDLPIYNLAEAKW